MSCNGCRVLRKGCSDNCMLRQCLQWIDSPQAQAHATVFVAKFFGRAGLMSFISSVPEHQRPALFQSLLFEAVGRTVNPVNGAVGLLWTGNWHVCQEGVETVLRGGALGPLAAESLAHNGGGGAERCNMSRQRSRPINKRRPFDDDDDDDEDEDYDHRGGPQSLSPADLDLCLMAGTTTTTTMAAKRRAATPSEESETTTLASSSADSSLGGGTAKILRLFV